MRRWHVVALIIGVLLSIQMVVLSIYLLVDDDSMEYQRDLSISVEWQDAGNRTAEDYTVTIPLLVYEGTGDPLITSMDQLEITLGRGEMELVTVDGDPFLRLTSDTSVTIKHHFHDSGEGVSPGELKAELSSQTGDLDADTASISIESDSGAVEVSIRFFQESISSKGTHRITRAECDVELNEGASRYPLDRIVPG